MEDNYQIFESENEWEENKSSPNNSYIKIKNPFIIQCSCGGDATIYQKYEFMYGQSHIIICNKCKLSIPLFFYGVDK